MEKETMVATVPQAEIVDEQQLSRDVTDIEFQAESLVIQTDEDYAFAGEFGKMLKKKASQVTTFFKPMKDSAYQAHKAVCDREKCAPMTMMAQKFGKVNTQQIMQSLPDVAKANGEMEALQKQKQQSLLHQPSKR